MNWGRRFLETKNPTSWIWEPKHDAQMQATLSKCSAYFTDSSGLDSHPSAARQSLPSVLMWPLPGEEKSPFLATFRPCVHIPPHLEQHLLQSRASLLAWSASSAQHLAVNADRKGIFTPPRVRALRYPPTIRIHHQTHTNLYSLGVTPLRPSPACQFLTPQEHCCEVWNSSGTRRGQQSIAEAAPPSQVKQEEKELPLCFGEYHTKIIFLTQTSRFL